MKEIGIMNVNQKLKRCIVCGGIEFSGIEYSYDHPERYDGVSEWYCNQCSSRYGRWSGRLLKWGEVEPRYGRTADYLMGEE